MNLGWFNPLKSQISVPFRTATSNLKRQRDAGIGGGGISILAPICPGTASMNVTETVARPWAGRIKAKNQVKRIGV